jgi:hypothetical protein
MTSTAKLWTLHGLSVELNRNTRTLAKALRTTRPDGKVGNYAGWYMSTALSALRRHEGPRDVGDSNVDAVCYDLEAVARALARMRKEQDIACELAREVGPLIGRLERVFKRSHALLSRLERIKFFAARSQNFWRFVIGGCQRSLSAGGRRQR